MSATPTPGILLVSRPDDAKEISAALVRAGFSAPAVAAGGDETLTLFREFAPTVVVLCASLEHGDARSLAAAMRASSGDRRLGIVLVGDAGGPIRNALDAADFEVDRFVGRPLSAKALAFAVRSCAREVTEAEQARAGSNGQRGNGHDGEPSWPTPRPLPPPPAAPERPPIVRAATTPGTGPPMPPGPVSPGLERAMNAAIARFVTDAMNALESGWALDSDRDEDQGTDDRRGREPAAGVQRDDGQVKEPAVDPSALTLAADRADAAPADASGWAEPSSAPAWREPTLILPDGGRTPVRESAAERASASAGQVDRVDVDITARQPSSPWEDDVDEDDLASGPSISAPGVQSSPVEPSALSPMDLEEASEAGLIARPTGERGARRSRPDSQSDLDTPSGESQAEPKSPLARELRRKMSMMAERLFPGRGGDRSRLDVGLAHNAHTEIDLAAIGLEAVEGVGGSAPYEGIGSVDTFADTNPLSRLEPTPEPMSADDGEDTGRRRSITGEPPPRGDLADIDIASLLGRLLQGRFTGRVQLRRGPAEKVVHFEDGRPVFAISNLPHDRMGDLLYREGKITREQQQRARDLVVESGRRMGEILVEIGFLKPRELLPAVRHHIEDIVYSLFAWDSGEFVISAGDPSSERIRLTRHPAALVLEGVRRKYGAELIEARLRSQSAVVAVRSQRRLRSQSAVVAVRSQRRLSSIAAVADLSPPERAVIQKLDGERTIQQAAEAAQVDPLMAFQLAWALIALGVAEVVDHGPLASEPTPVRARSLVGETDIAIDRQRVLAKYALVQEADYFTLLGVRRDATAFEIRRAYEAARRDYSAPGFPPEVQRELASELGEINRLIDEAYLILREERVRRSYQANLLD